MVVSAAALALLMWPRARGPEGKRAVAEFRAAREAWAAVQREWSGRASVTPFDEARSQLETAKSAYDKLMAKRGRLLAELNQRSFQMDRHLSGILIRSAHIPGVGASRVTTLSAHGYRTAKDVNGGVQHLYGFGPATTQRLLQWRAHCERSLRYNPRLSEDPKEVARIDALVKPESDALTATLAAGPEELERLRARIIAAREELQPRLEAAWSTFAVAKLKRRAA
jgi:DNA-binding helix-hairpin-helix protein with protein kinase domain